MFDGFKNKLKMGKAVKNMLTGSFDKEELEELLELVITKENVEMATEKIREFMADAEQKHCSELAYLVRRDTAGNPYVDILKIANNVPTGTVSRLTLADFVKQILTK